MREGFTNDKECIHCPKWMTDDCPGKIWGTKCMYNTKERKDDGEEQFCTIHGLYRDARRT